MSNGQRIGIVIEVRGMESRYLYLHTYVGCILGSCKQDTLQWTCQSSKIWAQVANCQQVLEYQMLHFVLIVQDLGRFLHNPHDQMIGYKFGAFLGFPGNEETTMFLEGE